MKSFYLSHLLKISQKDFRLKLVSRRKSLEFNYLSFECYFIMSFVEIRFCQCSIRLDFSVFLLSLCSSLFQCFIHMFYLCLSVSYLFFLRRKKGNKIMFFQLKLSSTKKKGRAKAWQRESYLG